MDKMAKSTSRSEISLKGIKEDIQFLRGSKRFFPTIKEIAEIRNIYPPLGVANSVLGGLILQSDIGPSDPYARFFVVLGQAVAFNMVGARSAINSLVAYVKTKKALLYHKEKSRAETVDVEQVTRMLQRMVAHSRGPAAQAGIEAAIHFCYEKDASAIIEKLFSRNTVR